MRCIQPRKTVRFEMRVSPEFMAMIDRWRARAQGIPSRAEAVRWLAELGEEAYRVGLWDGDKPKRRKP